MPKSPTPRRSNQIQEMAHLFSRKQLDKLTRAIDAQEQLHKNMMDLVKHHKKYPPKRTDAGLVIQDILYVDIVGIIGDFMKLFPDFDPNKYESTDEHGERIRERCRNCSFLRDDWKCNDCDKSVYDIPDDECSLYLVQSMSMETTNEQADKP